ncbi:hypothetical protein DPEC_G00295410 [Dallia pectoralis]|uniref:Uncharacterized protein n=1 Tax=Dallia pectoralis TaxID=75939 RepID=A0ACC2FIP6_DALPE|nr:hypothetical protein DPEC_G00295410 [Dallia pectoralis]
MYQTTPLNSTHRNHEALFDGFATGLAEEIKDELAARDLPRDIDSLIDLSTRIGNRLQEQHGTRHPERAHYPKATVVAERSTSKQGQCETGSTSAYCRNDPRAVDYAPVEPY